MDSEKASNRLQALSAAFDNTKDVKQVIVIRKDLKMRRGKEIAQGAHASCAWLADKIRHAYSTDIVGLSTAQLLWLHGGFKKVTVQVNSEEDLISIKQRCQAKHILCHLITDSGLTEFGGVPTNTALAVGPEFSHLMDPVTGDLELY